MNLPGFTAEATIYRSRGNYRTAGSALIAKRAVAQASQLDAVAGRPAAILAGGPIILPHWLCRELAACCVAGNQLCCAIFDKFCLPLGVCPALWDCCTGGLPIISPICCKLAEEYCLCPYLAWCCFVDGNPQCCVTWRATC